MRPTVPIAFIWILHVYTFSYTHKHTCIHVAIICISKAAWTFWPGPQFGWIDGMAWAIYQKSSLKLGNAWLHVLKNLIYTGSTFQLRQSLHALLKEESRSEWVRAEGWRFKVLCRSSQLDPFQPPGKIAPVGSFYLKSHLLLLSTLIPFLISPFPKSHPLSKLLGKQSRLL